MKLNECCKDIDGAYSSKRIVALTAFGLFVLGFGLATFTSVIPPEYMMHDLVYIIGGALGFVGLERFGRKA